MSLAPDPAGSPRWRCGPVEVRLDERRVLVDGVPAALGARAFDLLAYLAGHRDRVVGKDELLAQVWRGAVVEEGNLTVQVAALRKLLGRDALSTVSGRGYRFTGPVQTVPWPEVGGDTAGPTAPADKPSVAVMPFANLTGEAAQNWFIDGIVDDLTDALSRVGRFFVISRSSSFTYRHRTVDVPTVGREMGVRYVVEGSVRQAGERLRIGVQLVETGAGRQLWSQRFEGPRDDIFLLQDRISAEVTAAIEPNLVQAEVDRTRQRPTASLQAYELCLQAVPLVIANGRREHLDQALQLLRRAVQADPGYSYAKAFYAWAHCAAFANGWIGRRSAMAGMPYAQEAIADHRDDPTTLAFAGHALAYVAHALPEAGRALDLALALNPNSMTALRSSGWVRGYLCDTSVAVDHLRRALRLNPLDPEIGYVWAGIAFAHLIESDGPAALAAARRSLLEFPAFAPGQFALLHALCLQGQRDEAQRVLDSLRARMPSLTRAIYRGAQPYVRVDYVERCLQDLAALGLPP